MTANIVLSAARPVISYTHNNKCYVNITNRCTLSCAFCPKSGGNWTIGNHNLKLKNEPTVAEILAAVGDPRRYTEVVFSGLGEPTMRLYELLDAAIELRSSGGRVRVDTDGLANIVYGRDITPDLEGIVDSLSVSLNAQTPKVYGHCCQPPRVEDYHAMLEFVVRAREFVPQVTVTAVEGVAGVDIAACEKLARRLGVKFRARTLGVID